MKIKTGDKTIKRLTIFALLLVAIFILTAICVFSYFFGLFDGEREVIEIPEYVGKKYADIGELDKILLERELVFSDEILEGEIISQFPYAGARRKLADGERYTVRLTVSMGKETQSVPNLENYKYNEAAAALRSIGAKIRIVSIYNDQTEPDMVLGSSPTSGSRIERGDTVTLFVTRNHIHGSICVENFVGLPLDVACTGILAQGLTVGEVIEQSSENFASGEVISQSIAPESYVLYGTKIDITVNIGQNTGNLHPFRKDIISENGELNESVD
jgi:serine/threonine-protein kinase